MILTDTETQDLRRFTESQSRMGEESLRRTGHLLHLGAFDEAVRSAFVLLEERLREATGKEGMTGTRLADYAFNASSGPLSKHLGRRQSEREGLRELYSGAFKLFRNPTAHGAVRYDAAEGKALVSLVNLLLSILKRVEDLPAPEMIPENVEAILAAVEQEIGPGGASRLLLFIGKCIKAGILPYENSKQWIPFRRYALRLRDGWDEARAYHVAMFYLAQTASGHVLLFPITPYYSEVVGFNVTALTEELLELGFNLHDSRQGPQVDLKVKNDQRFFDDLFDLVQRTSDQLEATLHD